MTPVRTRFAPSPTGFLHIGGLRTALYCLAWAKKNNGKYIVRVEDTDLKRKVDTATEEIFSMLAAYDLTPDESMFHGGDYGPYLQSERKDIYAHYANQLIDKGLAYYCFLEGEELEIYKKQFHGKGMRSPYRDQDIQLSKQMIADGKPYVIRMKVPNNEIIEFKDGLQGFLKFDTNLVGDEVLIKSNGMGSYHLAVVVDDHLMKVSHVFRGFEWLPSTPKQILLHKYLGWEMPPYYHVSVILNPEGGKLSKRKGIVSARDFLMKGYLPEAVLNFLMLLGWSSPEKRESGIKERELFTLAEFVNLFDVKDFNKSNPIFNIEKLIWFNKEYIKALNDKDIVSKAIYWIEEYAEDKALLKQFKADINLALKLNLSKERATTLVELIEQTKFFYIKPSLINWDIEQLAPFKNKLKAIIADLYNIMDSFEEDSSKWLQSDWVEKMRELSKEYELKGGDSFMVLRMCIVGSPFSPPLFEAMQLMSKSEILSRIESSK